MSHGWLFLERCDPRAKLIALLLVVPVLLAQPLLSWWCGAIVVGVGLTVSLWSLARQLLRLRWLFAVLLLFHAFFTPGRPLLADWDVPTWEGVSAGVEQTLRLVLLISLPWILVRTTTPLQLLAGLYWLFGRLERVGVPVKQGFAITAFAMGRIPYLVQEAAWVREDLGVRVVKTNQTGWYARLQFTALGGEALLRRLLATAGCQEEALCARGFVQGLPFVIFQQTTLDWRDLLLLVLSAVIFAGGVVHYII